MRWRPQGRQSGRSAERLRPRQKYPKAFEFTYKTRKENGQYPIVGCYGLGTTRLMGTLVEVMADEKGMRLPESVAPFRLHLVSLAGNDAAIAAYADALYADLAALGASVLYDDRDLRAGEKFNDSDLIGIPYRIIIGKEAASSGRIEVVNRATGDVKHLSREEVVQF